LRVGGGFGGQGKWKVVDDDNYSTGSNHNYNAQPAFVGATAKRGVLAGEY